MIRRDMTILDILCDHQETQEVFRRYDDVIGECVMCNHMTGLANPDYRQLKLAARGYCPGVGGVDAFPVADTDTAGTGHGQSPGLCPFRDRRTGRCWPWTILWLRKGTISTLGSLW